MSEQVKHTPLTFTQWANKPIIFLGTATKNTPQAIGGCRVMVADMSDAVIEGELTRAEAIKIAHLIAAAPDLLEALTDLVESSTNMHRQVMTPSPCCIEAARAAIAKAKGLTHATKA